MGKEARTRTPCADKIVSPFAPSRGADVETRWRERSMRLRLGICAILLMSSPTAVGQTLLIGHGAETVVRSGVNFLGAPLLDGFYLRFGPRLGLPSETDRHFGFLEAGGDRPFHNRVSAGFGDKHSGDFATPFAYALSFHPRYGLTSLGSIGGQNLLGTVSFELDRPDSSSVFLLRGFRIGWMEKDHHIQRLAILENAGVLTVALEDARGATFPLSTRLYEAQVDYAYIPRNQVVRRSTSRGAVEGNQGGAAEQAIWRGPSVLVGFDLRFTNGDHHIREIGVWTPDDGRVQVFFNDKNADDPFEWEVQWAVLHRDVWDVRDPLDPRNKIDRPGPKERKPPGGKATSPARPRAVERKTVVPLSD